MKAGTAMFAALVLSGSLMCGCGGDAGTAVPAPIPNPTPNPAPQTGPPLFFTANAQNGAVIVTLEPAAPGATLHYTTDGSTPTTASQIYEAPFLVASNLTVNAIAVTNGGTPSKVNSQTFTPNIASGTLVWSDEFSNPTGTIAAPNPNVWTYDTGNSGFGNHELENYCAWGSNVAPCSTANPSAYVGTDGYLHIEAQQPSPGIYTSARLKTQGLFSVPIRPNRISRDGARGARLLASGVAVGQ
jgi:hypothetical protein